MFPCFAEIVAGVPASDRYPSLSELEHTIDRLGAAHPEIEVWSPARPRPSKPRTVR